MKCVVDFGNPPATLAAASALLSACGGPAWPSLLALGSASAAVGGLVLVGLLAALRFVR